jgi:predicted GNAT family acetyltransferase
MIFQVRLDINEKGNGSFNLFKDDECIGGMSVEINWPNMIVYHTEVNPSYKGQGLAKIIFDEMVVYAKNERLKVTPFCSFVLVSFDKDPKRYQDIWDKK